MQYDSQKIDENYPTMWMSEISCIEKILEEQAAKGRLINVLEYGSGKSTIYFSKFLKRKGVSFSWTALEHFIPWYEKVISDLNENDLLGTTKCILKSPTYEENKDIHEKQDMSEYINYPLDLKMKFDVVIVDGRKRAECLQIASRILAQDGVAILHDAEREGYHSAFCNFKDDGQFICVNKAPIPGGEQKLWMGCLPLQ